MKLQDQVCSLELSKRLKILGVKQESYFYWCLVQTSEHGDPKWKLWDEQGTQSCSAFTVAELGEMLPQYFESWRFSDTKKKDKDRWECAGHEEGNPTPPFDGVTEADARAKMLIYLIENKLIPAPGKE